ncbi:hypothetical protein Tco_0907534 [Tanacetum coccineum]|uniref:Reverse transcriptase Ty1/copia-type domain-containing protein n=1 Tax=Tanacetum coccineum TaxID=301880 RepID=A0ABQ5CKM1_9ASTR
MERDLGTRYSFERKPCFVCGSLSHLIKDCDYYEKKMAREAAFKSTRVVHANVRQATPAWTNSNRVNKENQFTPRPVQLNNIRPNLSTASKTIIIWIIYLEAMEHRGIFDSGMFLGHMTGIRAHLENYKNISKVDLFTFGGSKGSISGKVKALDSMNYIPVSLQNQANPACSKEVLDIDVQTEEAADLMKTHTPKEPSSTPISKSADDIMTFRKELDALALKHLGPVPATAPTGSINLNTAFEEVNYGNIEAISPSADHEEEFFKLQQYVLDDLPNVVAKQELKLSVKQNKGGIFISQDKYVAEILKKFDLVNVKAAITPMETKLPLTKDEEAFDVDVAPPTPKTSHLNAVQRIFKYLRANQLGIMVIQGESTPYSEALSDSD